MHGVQKRGGGGARERREDRGAGKDKSWRRYRVRFRAGGRGEGLQGKEGVKLPPSVSPGVAPPGGEAGRGLGYGPPHGPPLPPPAPS